MTTTDFIALAYRFAKHSALEKELADAMKGRGVSRVVIDGPGDKPLLLERTWDDKAAEAHVQVRDVEVLTWTRESKAG